MGQRIKRFDFVSRDPPQVGFESRVMGHYPARPGKAKGRWWEFGKVGPIGCLHSSDGTDEERNEVRGRGSGKRVESIRLDDREKQNEIRIWPKKKQGYGYHDRSPSIKKNLSKSLRVSGAFKHPKYAGVVNGILIENDDSFRKTKLFKFFFPKKSRSDGPTSHLQQRTLPAVRSSLNYSVMQYLLNTKNKMHFDPVVVLNHFVAPGVAEPSTMGGANAQERSLDKRIRSRIAFFVESSTSEKKCLAEAKKRLTHFIRQANDLRFAGTTKTTISLFPFFGATFFFPRDGVGVYNNLFFENAREQLLGQLRRKCWNLMAKDKVMELIEKFIDLGRSEGAEIARTECGKYGKTSCNVFNQKIDYAPAEVSTRYGILGRCSRGCKPDGTQLGFGRYGTKSCRAGRLSYRAIEAARRAIIGHFHRAMSGQFRRNGKIWVRVLADIPITGKPTEVRMGRGKGNPTGWIARVSTGQILFEMDGVSLSNARQAATLAAHKLCSSTKFVQWSKRRSTIGCSLIDLSSQEGEAPSNGRKGEWIDVMIPESCDMDSAGFIMLLIGLDLANALSIVRDELTTIDGVAMMSLTPSLDPPQVESLSSGGHSFLSGNAPLSPSCSVLLPGSGKSLVDRDGCR
ncbi:hypothetical protein BUALT_BualtMtG0002400 (mitochondrion) [Buddleja alternifolia]|uniref:Ribosomal protein L16 n=1 Tax=Buddleja alternifolia TaxID=168488 RepID=A0AAV6W887_9LAMI|nr:hypothetical protein BUALT_BualtMtG0002400 [Buddleja alternifolia]